MPTTKHVPASVYQSDSVTSEARTRSGRIKGNKNKGLTTDATFAWVSTLCQSEEQAASPMEKWRQLAEEYMGYLNSNRFSGSYSKNLFALRCFLERYLWKHRLLDPDLLFTLPSKSELPRLQGSKKDTPFKDNAHGAQMANYIHDFLTWVLREKYSSDEDGHRVPYPHHRLPFARAESGHFHTPDQSVLSPLPYKYIRQLREMLAEGNNFRDWEWAQNASGNLSGSIAGDWFEVPESLIDKNDPDCVWRTRDITIHNYHCANPDPDKSIRAPVGKRTAFEMWSPVTAVALLVKLEMPFRTYQVRMLDSGEMDFHRVELDPEGEEQFIQAEPEDTNKKAPTKRKPLFKWVPNTKRDSLLTSLSINDRVRISDCQGVFLKSYDNRIGDYVGFFINTNKTADADKDWNHRGYRIDWQHDSLLRWLVKLRNWQQKYNPIAKPTLWTELQANHTRNRKSDADLAEAAPTCFLFRDASVQGKPVKQDASTDNERKPLPDGKVIYLWFKLLCALEDRITALGEQLHFVKRDRQRSSPGVYYPLHALRVSLITAFADAGMGLDILMRIAGHTRLVMTIYYRKLNSFQLNQAIRAAQENLTKRADELTVQWLKGKAYEDLPSYVVANEDGLKAALPRNPNDRNPAGWERQLGGWCLMGGNIVPTTTDHNSSGGCYNGGMLIKEVKTRRNRIYAGVHPKACI